MEIKRNTIKVSDNRFKNRTCKIIAKNCYKNELNLNWAHEFLTKNKPKPKESGYLYLF